MPTQTDCERAVALRDWNKHTEATVIVYISAVAEQLHRHNNHSHWFCCETRIDWRCDAN
jgi:hypothetical protein